MLHAVAKLPKHDVRHIDRVLRHEVNPDSLGPDQPDDLLNLALQRRRQIIEEQVRLVEEEDQFRLVEIARFRQFFVQLRQQPQQQCRV